jgi:tetratricopeptide (TPR) repeat protein
MAKIGLRAYNREIDLLIERGQIDEAIAHCKYILRFYPKHIETYRLLGKAYIESQRYSEGADILQRILSVIPDDFVSQIGMSIIREDEGNLDAAIFHMERAREIQPSNVAIQDELRRLYGRRDGVEPPRLRLTRGALVRLYAKGDLYRQAIAEIRAALAEDPNRFDLDVILARMYHSLGQKVEATDIASRLVTKLPYCLEANRVLADVLPTTARAEDAKIYQQRMYSLDPYLAYVSQNAPTSSQVPDNAVTLDRLDWQGPATIEEQPAWAQNVGVSFTSEEEAEITPEWLSAAHEESAEGTAEPAAEAESSPAPAGTSEMPTIGESQIPDWMREAGWEVSGRAGPELPAAESAEGEEAIVPGEIPDWLKGMAPAAQAGGSMEDERKLDWLDQILPPAETAEATPVETGKPESALTEETPAEPGLQEGEIFPQAEAEEPLPDWLTFPELETSEVAPSQESVPSFAEETEVAAEGAAPTAPEEIVEEAPPAEGGPATPEAVAEAAAQEAAPVVPEESLAEALPQEVEAAAQEAAPVVPEESIVEALPQEVEPAAPEAATEAAAEEAAPVVPEESLAEAFPQEVEPAAPEAVAEVVSEETAPTVSEEIVAGVLPQEGEPEVPQEMAGVVPEEEATAIQPEGTTPAFAEEAAGGAIAEEVIQPVTEEVLAANPPQEEAIAAVSEEAIMPEETFPTFTEEPAEVIPEPEAAQAGAVEEVPSQEAVQTFPEEELEFIPAVEEKPAEPYLSVVEETAPVAEAQPIAKMPVEEAVPEITPAVSEPEAPPSAEEVDTSSEEKTQPIQVAPPAARESEMPVAPAVEPASEAGPSDIDAAMAWLESLAAKQGADEATLSTSAAERPAAPPEWVTAELEKAQEAGEEIPAPVEPMKETAPVQDLAEAVPAQVEEIAAEIQVPAVEEPAPAEAPQAAVSPEQMSEDEAFAWLESLAARQGAEEGTLITPEEKRPTTAPSWVAEQAAAEPGLTDASELLEGSLTGVEEAGGEKEASGPETEVMKPEEMGFTVQAEGGVAQIAEIQEPPAQVPEMGEWVAEAAQAPEVQEVPAPEVPAAEAEVPPAESEEPLPSWLQEFEPAAGQEVKEIAPASEEDLPDWLKGFESPAEAPITQASDESISVSTWLKEEVPPQPSLEEPGVPASASQASPEPAMPEPAASILGEGFPSDSGAISDNPLLAQAQNDLRNGNTANAANILGQLIENGQNLEEIIPVLQESLYRYPVDISLWQTLGDAYIRSNRIQEALDAYTKAEELLK